MEEGSRRTKDRKFIVELKDRAMNRILLLDVKIESKRSAFDIKENSGAEKNFFLFLSYGRVVGRKPRPTWYKIVICYYKENKLSSSTHCFG